MRFMYCREVKKPSRGFKVSIIGAGPAGLAAAGYLACSGIGVEVYDAMPEPGGYLVFGVYHGRLPRRSVREGVEELRRNGVVFHEETHVSSKLLEELLSDSDAVLVATGAWRPRRLMLPGSGLPGVMAASGYIVSFYKWRLGYSKTRPPEPGRVVVVGGGHTAIDACMVSMDMGAEEVYLVYRRTRFEAPAGPMAFNMLEKRGVRIIELASPVEYIGGSRLEAVRLVRMRLAGVDETGRPRPEPIPGSEFTIEADTVLEAVGLKPTPPPSLTGLGVEVTRRGGIAVSRYHMTSREPLFAAGDVVHGASTIGKALKSGLEAAKCIEEYLEGRLRWIPPGGSG